MHEAALTLVLMAKPVRLLWKKKEKNGEVPSIPLEKITSRNWGG